MTSALKDIFGSMFEAMLQGEMDDHLGYASNDHGKKKLQTEETDILLKKSIPLSGMLRRYSIFKWHMPPEIVHMPDTPPVNTAEFGFSIQQTHDDIPPSLRQYPQYRQGWRKDPPDFKASVFVLFGFNIQS